MPRLVRLLVYAALALGASTAAALLAGCAPMLQAAATTTSTAPRTTSAPQPASAHDDDTHAATASGSHISSVFPSHIDGYDYRTPRVPTGLAPQSVVRQMEVRMLIPRSGDQAAGEWQPVVAAISIRSNTLTSPELIQQRMAGPTSQTREIADKTVNVMDGTDSSCTMVWLKDSSTLVYAFRAPCDVLEPIMAAIIRHN